jgi:hypothetical protein
VKAAFDPDNMLNPGVLVDPRPVSADIRAVRLVDRSRTSARLSIAALAWANAWLTRRADWA